MYLLRQARREDLDSLRALCAFAQKSMVNLTTDPHLLEERIRFSDFNFSLALPSKVRYFLFVLEDLSTRKIIGTSAIKRERPLAQDFLFKSTVNEIPYLKFSSIESTHTEMCGLFLHPDYRGRFIARLLSYGRLLFIADHLSHFEQKCVADLKGVMEKECSVFWKEMGSALTGLSFAQAVNLYLEKPEALKNFFPQDPFPLPPSLFSIIGEVDATTKGAEKMVSSWGMHKNSCIHPLDLGPRYEGFLNALKPIKESQIIHISPTKKHGEEVFALISNTKMPFKAVLSPYFIENEVVHIPENIYKVFVEEHEVSTPFLCRFYPLDFLHK